MSRIFFTVLATTLLIAGCATVQFSEDISDYEAQIIDLKTKIERNPQDAAALRDLGVIYFQTRHYDDAKISLANSYKVNKEDAKTQLYLGFCAEFDQNDSLALRFYQNYTEFSRLSRYRNLMEGRYRWITREIARKQVQRLMNDPAAQVIDDDAVAVFPLIYQGADQQYSSVGRGLSEMVLIDLGQIESLKLVERIRIQAILNELANANTPYVDPTTSPRYGHIIGAGRIIGGNFNVSDTEQMLINASYWDVAVGGQPAVASHEDALTNLFAAQKQLVFELLNEMGVEPTSAQRARIERTPTKNLQAFIAYCIGLEYMDTGRFSDAEGAFQQAVSLDPGFSAAQTSLDESASIGEASGSLDEIAATAREGDDGLAAGGASGSDPVGERLQSIGESIGSGFFPGEDNRSAAEEADASGTIPGLLPEPPPPPQ